MNFFLVKLTHNSLNYVDELVKFSFSGIVIRLAHHFFYLKPLTCQLNGTLFTVIKNLSVTFNHVSGRFSVVAVTIWFSFSSRKIDFRIGSGIDEIGVYLGFSASVMGNRDLFGVSAGSII